MPISELSVLERIARVLAGQHISVNAEGYEPSAGDEVDREWHLYLGQALAVLKTLREPDIVIANAGNAEIWRAMIEAAIGDFEGDGERTGPHDQNATRGSTRINKEDNPDRDTVLNYDVPPESMPGF